jgi:hypothetical protein
MRREADDPDSARRLDIEHRDAQAPGPAGFELATGPSSEEEPNLSWFRLDPCDPPDIGGFGKRKRDPATSTKILEFVRNHSDELTRRAGAVRLGMNHRTFNAYFAELEADGRVRVDGHRMVFVQ